MPGYSPTQLAYKVQNSNQCSILIGDQLVGFGQTVAPHQDYGTEGLYGIGDAKPQEIQQLKFSQTISLDSFRLTKEGLAFFGITTPLGQILAYNQFNFYLLDSDGTPFLAYVGCVAQSNNINVAANQPITEAITFLAMDVLDANGVSVLNSNSVDAFNFLASSTSVVAGA